MNRIDRLQAILIQLQSKQIVKAQEIADRFEISLRTVYRDIRALDKAGVPIGSEAGIGYFLMEGYHLPPVMFTNPEANALVLGAKLVEKMTDASINAAFQSALYKVKSVLKSHSKESVADMEQRIEVRRNLGTPPPFENHFLLDIQQAIVQQNVLEIEYSASRTAQPTRRNIEPIGLLHYGSGWHLIAFCQLRNDYRDFRVDRIGTLGKAGKTFRAQSAHSFQAYLAQIVQTLNLEEAVILFDKSVACFVGEQKYAYGFIAEESLENQVRMRFLTAYPEALAHWLLMYTNAITIEKPAHLREKMRQLTAELQRHYL